MSSPRLFFLGPPRIERDGAIAKVDTRKAIALTAYLTVTGGRHSRDALATLLWPDYDQTRARAALRRTLSALRRVIGMDTLVVDRESIGLDDTANWWSDLEQFQNRIAECRTHGHAENDVCLACLKPLTEAVTLYRGDFMEGFTLRDSLDFDDWQFFQTESLRGELAGVLGRLVRGHSVQGEYDSAIAFARRWLGLDPLHEPAHRQLMQLYAWSGRRSTAMRQYRECVKILDKELGVPPLEETTRLYQDIEAYQELQPPTGAPTVSPELVTARLTDYPLVGRSTEWSTLLSAYSAVELDGHWIVLEGEAGIGKTRLAEEFVAYVRSRGSATISARCYDGEAGLAYGPFVEALRVAISGPDCDAQLEELPPQSLIEAARLLPELAELIPNVSTDVDRALLPAPSLDSPGAQIRFFEALNQILMTLCAGAPPVVFLDDVHWADEASLDLLTYLVRRLHGRPLLILVTWRDENVPAGHRLRHLIAETRRSRIGTIISLTRLAKTDVEELVRSADANANDASDLTKNVQLEALTSRLYRESEGLPFFLMAYLAELVNAADPVSSDEWPLPDSVRDLLQARLAGSSDTGRQLLTTAAVIGRWFNFDTLRSASGRAEEETVVGLEELMGKGLVRELQDAAPEFGPVYDFAHEKLRTYVYEETSLARKRLLHRRVAETLSSPGRGRHEIPAPVAQVAQHYQLAGQDAIAARYYKQAGEHARDLFANAEALIHFRSALALGDLDSALLHESIGDLETLMGDYRAALISYETAAALCESEKLAFLEHKLGQIHDRRGEWDLAESHYEAAAHLFGEIGDVGQRARLFADWSRTAHHNGQSNTALDLALEALQLAETGDDQRAQAQASNILGILARHGHELDRAEQHLEHSLELAEALNAPDARVAALNNLALVRSDRGETALALALCTAALDLCASQGDRHREAALHNHLADLYYEMGQSETAMAHLKQAVAIFAEIGEETGGWQPEIWKLVEW